MAVAAIGSKITRLAAERAVAEEQSSPGGVS
jgi:hypothetical protein